MQAINVIAQFEQVHLKRLAYLAVEVAGRLGQFLGSCRSKALIMSNGAVGKIPNPAAFKHPTMLRFGPSGARCKNAAAQLEIRRINFQNAESSEQVLGRIKEIVIVNLVVFSKDPALRMSVSLRRPALDLVMQGVLLLVGIRKIGVVQQNHRRRERQSSQKQDA